MDYDAIVVGGGIAGLTTAAFIAKAGRSVLLCEKEPVCGGLVNSFTRDGFTYDGGIRAMENSGVLFPMMKSLGIKIDFVKNHVSVGIEDRVIRIDSDENTPDYQSLLNSCFPESLDELERIFAEIRRIMHYMDVQYGIDNPVFLNIREDRDYFMKAILPWMFKYVVTAPKIATLNVPVVEFLKRFTNNQSLLDNITQHFFRDTPAFFALSYLKLYQDYYYPVGGTGRFVKELVSFIESHGGKINPRTEINGIDPDVQMIWDSGGNAYHYERLIWAADQKSFYRMLKLDGMKNKRVIRAIKTRQAEIADKVGNDSVLTLFLGLDLSKDYFSKIASEHFFYTPDRTGQSRAGEIPLNATRAMIEEWLRKFFALTTYEISCPVMRDASLAPEGKAGLIISVLFDYRLTKQIESMGWYDDFKVLCEDAIIDTLNSTIYPRIRRAVVHQFTSTPLTLEKYTHNTDGAITGWALYNRPIPAESRIPRIMNAVVTSVPNVYQAGQWTYSPSGFPISLITGKIAADKTIKETGRK